MERHQYRLNELKTLLMCSQRALQTSNGGRQFFELLDILVQSIDDGLERT
jgi:hypothetical protein